MHIRASRRVCKNPLPILIFWQDSKNALQQLPISTSNFFALEKNLPDHVKIYVRICLPIWRWKDMRRNKEKDIVPNTNIQEKESIKVVDVTSNSAGLLIQNWPLYFRS
jgi:hypothetical protein